MPCTSNYQEANSREKESKKLMLLLAEIGEHQGEIPYYGKTELLDEHTEKLCDFCQNNDVTGKSLELQIWWRDHQEADKARLESEQAESKTEQEKNAAISKLTDYERKLLGL